MFFFFFFNELYNIPDIKVAFKKICLDKMLSDGYFDMSAYVFARIKKDDMLSKLSSIGSKYECLYRKSFPKENNAVKFWTECFVDETLYLDEDEIHNITLLEAKAIVYWVYRVFNNAQDRITFTKELFKQLKELYGVKNYIAESNGVFYNKRKVEVHFIDSLNKYNKFIANMKVDNKCVFFRGHSNANYRLQPSIMRNNNWEKNEREMYNELMIECPECFEKCNTHLERLVEMQHYGLPTRLLDITRNPLVALFFACESNADSYGEVVLITTDKENIKYPQSDTATVLSSLPLFKYDDKQRIKYWAENAHDDVEFNNNVPRLLHEIRLEKPAFLSEIFKEDIIKSFVVLALKNNNRIVKQDGAFILCGLIDEDDLLNKYRYKSHKKTVVLLIDKKKKTLEALNRFSINNSTLFPEIDKVSEHIKKKYS